MIVAPAGQATPGEFCRQIDVLIDPKLSSQLLIGEVPLVKIQPATLVLEKCH
jgi:hypothetical protein